MISGDEQRLVVPSPLRMISGDEQRLVPSPLRMICGDKQKTGSAFSDGSFHYSVILERFLS